MPAGDGTGPLGLGPRTGRGLGYCAGYPVAGYVRQLPGRGFFRGGFGFGRGFGRGFGYRWNFYANPYYGAPYYPQAPAYMSKDEEKAVLVEQAKEIENELKAIKDRIAELEKKEGL